MADIYSQFRTKVHQALLSLPRQRNHDLTEETITEIMELVRESSQASPDYVVAEAEDVVRRVQAVRNETSLVLSARSDWHLVGVGNEKIDPAAAPHCHTIRSAQLSQQGINEIAARIPLDADLDLGDRGWTTQDAKYTAEMCLSDIMLVNRTEAQASPPARACIRQRGNHDLLYNADRDRMVTPEELFGHIEAGNGQTVVDEENPIGGYGYHDFERQRIRLIYLNTCDVYDEKTFTDGEVAPSEWISAKQRKWVGEKALNFSDKDDPSAWGIVITSHHPINYSYSCFKYLLKILEAYRNGGTVSDSGTFFDFTTTTPAEFLCAINGHSHNFRTDYVSSSMAVDDGTSTAGWLLRMTVPNICFGRYNEAATSANEWFRARYGEFDENGDPVYYQKSENTADATSFYIISIDRKNRMVYGHCFGAGHDVACPMDNPALPTYTNLIPLSTDTDGSIYNGIGYKEDTYLSEGTPGYRAGVYTTGFMPIPCEITAPTLGQFVIRLYNMNGLPTDGNCRIAFYAEDMSLIAQKGTTQMRLDSDSQENENYSKIVMYPNDSGYIERIDPCRYLFYLWNTNIGIPRFFRVCWTNLSADSAIVLEGTSV